MLRVPIAVARCVSSVRSAITAAAAGQSAALPIPSIRRSGTNNHAERSRVMSSGAALLRNSPQTMTGRRPMRSARLPHVVLNTVSTAAKVATTTPTSVALAPRRSLRYSGSRGMTVANPSSAMPTMAATRMSAESIPGRRPTRLPGSPLPQPGQHHRAGPRRLGVRKGGEDHARVPAFEGLANEAVGERRVLWQKRPMQVRAVDPAGHGAFPPVLAVVAEPGQHASERPRPGAKMSPAPVVLESEQRIVHPLDLDHEVPDQPPGGGTGMLRPEVEQAQPLEVLALGRTVVPARELISSTDREHDAAVPHGLLERRPLDPAEIVGGDPLLTVFAPADEEQVPRGRGDRLAEPHLGHGDGKPSPPRPLNQDHDVAAVAVAVQEAGVEMADAQRGRRAQCSQYLPTAPHLRRTSRIPSIAVYVGRMTTGRPAARLNADRNAGSYPGWTSTASSGIPAYRRRSAISSARSPATITWSARPARCSKSTSHNHETSRPSAMLSLMAMSTTGRRPSDNTVRRTSLNPAGFFDRSTRSSAPPATMRSARPNSGATAATAALTCSTDAPRTKAAADAARTL